MIEKSTCEVADEVGAVALVGLLLSVHLDEDGVVVQALAREDLPIIEAAGGVDEVPFADDGRLVAGGLQILGDVGDGGVELVGEGLNAGQVGVEPGHDDAAAGGADGVGDEAVGKAHAAGGEAIDVGGLIDLAAVGADGVGGVVVRHDEEDVGSAGGRLGGKGGGGEQGEELAAGHMRSRVAEARVR